MTESYIPITRKEEYLLDACRNPLCYPAYIKLKRIMSWKTGIAGQERGISHQWLRESLYKEKSQGSAEFSITYKQSRCIINELEKVGLIKTLSKSQSQKGQLILKIVYYQGTSPSKISRAGCRAGSRAGSRAVLYNYI